MEFLSDDPTYPAIVLSVLALAFFVMLNVTQQGKYLIFTGATVAMLAGLFLIERMWVTENERIEDVIVALAKAVETKDIDRAVSFLTSDCVLERTPDRGNFIVGNIVDRFAGPVTAASLRQEIGSYEFEWLKVARLQAHAGELSRQGSAECVIHVSAKNTSIPAFHMTPPSGMSWSFGLHEESPHVWKVSRITPGRLGEQY